MYGEKNVPDFSQKSYSKAIYVFEFVSVINIDFNIEVHRILAMVTFFKVLMISDHFVRMATSEASLKLVGRAGEALSTGSPFPDPVSK